MTFGNWIYRDLCGSNVFPDIVGIDDGIISEYFWFSEKNYDFIFENVCQELFNKRT